MGVIARKSIRTNRGFEVKIKNMKVTFESEDTKEINRLAKSVDMACALFEIKYNLFRKVELDIDIAEEINRILEDNGINLDELLQ